MKRLGLLVFLAFAACGNDDGGVPVGQFDLRWTIINFSGPGTCEAVGADTFEWRVDDIFTGNVDIFLFDCTDYGGRTDFLPYSTYDARARLIGAGQVLGEASTFDLVLNVPVYAVPNFAFQFN